MRTLNKYQLISILAEMGIEPNGEKILIGDGMLTLSGALPCTSTIDYYIQHGTFIELFLVEVTPVRSEETPAHPFVGGTMNEWVVSDNHRESWQVGEDSFVTCHTYSPIEIFVAVQGVPDTVSLYSGVYNVAPLTLLQEYYAAYRDEATRTERRNSLNVM